VGKNGVKEFYALSDACLVPLRDIPLFETFIPSKMFEIMAMGRPIIGSVRGEAADILRRSKAALVVEPEDSESIALAILQIYNNPKKAVTMGKSARQFVVSNYSRDYLASLYLQEINEAVQKSWRHY
jgi:glycosyltransferase involved in cell wall biosynthesis